MDCLHSDHYCDLPGHRSIVKRGDSGTPNDKTAYRGRITLPNKTSPDSACSIMMELFVFVGVEENVHGGDLHMILL
ncbi:hypothetical protein TNCV_867831 [Trichonephila clavipes]|nr:hypothetical protein TNCV_867831 [Trichonephila clavipes]